MAVEIFPDSPRISFSHDLISQNDVVPIRSSPSPSSSSSIDFAFCVFRETFDRDHQSSYSSADELFSDGKLLPIQIKKRSPPPPPRHPPPPPPPHKTEEKQNNNNNNNSKSSSSSSFWPFKRSASLNGDNGYARTSLCPLPLLSRSNSTGSTNGAKRSSSVSNNQKLNFAKYSSPNGASKQSSSSSHQKPPLKNNSNGFYTNGVKINPVLNVPPANLFGLGSIFSGGKDRSRKK